MKKNTAVLLIGFGGPTSMAEVRPFLASVLKGANVPAERIEEVYRHYEAVGGASPYNQVTFRQQKALRAVFEARGVSIPVYAGFRHSEPDFKSVFLEMKKQNVQKVIGFVLSPFRTHASFERYQDQLAEARKESGSSDIEVVYTGPFHSDPSFIAAQARHVAELAENFSQAERGKTFLIFSAHSVPVPMSDKSGYAGQFLESASLVARQIGFSGWIAAYQSRSGHPGDAWLSPDVKDIIRAVDTSQYKNVLLIPIGFLSDNVEVLYDLDREAKEAAESRRLRYYRASTVMDEPGFIQMMANLVLNVIASGAKQ